MASRPKPDISTKDVSVVCKQNPRPRPDFPVTDFVVDCEQTNSLGLSVIFLPAFRLAPPVRERERERETGGRALL